MMSARRRQHGHLRGMSASERRAQTPPHAVPPPSGHHADSATPRRERTQLPSRLLITPQLAIAGWLMVSPFLLQGASALVAAKDVAVGSLLLVVTLAAVRIPAVRRAEAGVCVALGAVLIITAVGVEFGPGDEAAIRQWNEIISGILLVFLASFRTR